MPKEVISAYKFTDGSGIIFHADGECRLFWPPESVLEPYREPMCKAYYREKYESGALA